MVIGTAVQRGSFIYVYDERGRQLSALAARDGLQGYTGTTVSIRGGSFIYTFDGKGRQLSVTSAR